MSLRDVKKVTVEVTRQDILLGEPNDSERCPVALALRRQHPRVRCIAVEYKSAFMGQWSWTLDPGTSEFVRRFDAHQLVRPRKVTLVKEG